MSELAFEKKKREFLPENYAVRDWESLKVYFEDLKAREPNSSDSFFAWLRDKSELEAIISEDFAWRYIKMTCHTDDAALQQAYQDFVENIQPHLAEYGDVLNQK